MSDEKSFALVDSKGVVTNVITATQEFVDSLPALISDAGTDTGSVELAAAYDASELNVSIGDVRDKDGKFTTPSPTEEELQIQQDAEDAEAQRVADDARLLELRGKVGRGKPGLTADERDEFNLIMATRSLSV